MEISRRDFLKLSGATAGGVAVIGLLPKGTVLAGSQAIPLRKRVGEKTTICCFCGVGCGAIVAADTDMVVNIEGDPDHPINQGTLCPKGQALSQMRTVDGQDNPRRLTRPLYRRAGGTEWEPMEWDEALTQIAAKIKTTRDTNWKPAVTVGTTNYAVNRTEAIASFGGGELDNEECYLLVKMARALGLVYIEHCARI